MFSGSLRTHQCASMYPIVFCVALWYANTTTPWLTLSTPGTWTTALENTRTYTHPPDISLSVKQQEQQQEVKAAAVVVLGSYQRRLTAHRLECKQTHVLPCCLTASGTRCAAVPTKASLGPLLPPPPPPSPCHSSSPERRGNADDY